MDEKTRAARQGCNERWDLIPGEFQSLSEVARVAAYGRKKYPANVWKALDPDSDQSPINHGLRHGFKALEYPAGSEERIWQLAKASWNFLAAIWFEKQRPSVVELTEGPYFASVGPDFEDTKAFVQEDEGPAQEREKTKPSMPFRDWFTGSPLK